MQLLFCKVLLIRPLTSMEKSVYFSESIDHVIKSEKIFGQKLNVVSAITDLLPYLPKTNILSRFVEAVFNRGNKESSIIFFE